MWRCNRTGSTRSSPPRRSGSWSGRRGRLRAHRDASAHLAGGVASSLQVTEPSPVWVSHGKGSRLTDLDGNDYLDLNNGYGALVVGHAHPEVVAAVEERLIRGSHFAQPTTEVAEVAEALSTRFGLPLWRFGSSGTEATMDAVHLMRAHTGRDLIVKAEGAYHGHHDTVRAGPGVPRCDECPHPRGAVERPRRLGPRACRAR